ncbi:MAG: SDR family NAD(P)-dependent oxidoreductase [Prevotellaceae bacterium]|nr:SDR family NAD(P)-dependent oxidoreductase [Prevotellaceae bacterium]
MELKTVLVTGAASGIGEACAIRFAREGFSLILNGRNLSRLDALKQLLTEKYGAKVVLLPFDVRDGAAARDAIDSLPDAWKSIDVLINNAGLVLGLDKEYETAPDDWDVMIDTNVKGILTLTRLVTPGMIGRGRGHVINIGSIAGDAAYAGGSVYCATKAAVKALSDGLRIDLVNTPLRVTNVKPGMVETEFSITRFRGDKERANKVYAGLKPLTGADVAEVVMFAVSAPPHVQIAEVLVMPTSQATATVVNYEL